MYGFIRKIKPFHLRMEHIIQITAMAGLAVPNSLKPIFQYILDCFGKRPLRSIRSIRKIIALELRKSKRHHWETDAPTTSDCSGRILVWWHHWAIFLRKWARSRHSVNGERYRAMFNVFCFQKLKRITWTSGFNNRGPLCHTAKVTIALLRTVFENRIISWNSDVD